MVIRPHQAPTDAQLETIAAQLGRPPRGLEAVAATDSHGRPLVLRMAPIVDDAPFPTLYWLSCEKLKVVLSRLEASGVIKELEARLQQDPEWMASYHESHADYVRQRWEWMTEAQRAEVERRGYTELMRERGIGGITNWDQVRCLHTQYAHHLCGDNAIGRWLDEQYDVAASIP
ncbi:DUF501 domain-containing protein [Salinicola rhizosphaerae]|uniref:DUF501 domain-containing protein n=1 Tax=Salinicola rhizosphaerae TaxID=1443141 RepID=A0ABQ3DUW0_9GAMM|nr:DUF501 domain-containing protein [Salinicola rhizosphaerae]GHB17227.1 hypothetical protein GCM10009038_14950 [Salinicola rhizosphaerae]